MLKDLTLEASGMSDDVQTLGGKFDGIGGGETPPIFSPPRMYTDDGVTNSFSTASISTAASNAVSTVSNAASTVGTAVSSAASTVGTKATSLVSSVSTSVKGFISGLTNSSTGTAGAKTSTDSSMMWLWVLLAAVAGFGVYLFARKGKRGSKFFTSRAGGSHVKSYGK